jgi:hypothetical protein
MKKLVLLLLFTVLAAHSANAGETDGARVLSKQDLETLSSHINGALQGTKWEGYKVFLAPSTRGPEMTVHLIPASSGPMTIQGKSDQPGGQALQRILQDLNRAITTQGCPNGCCGPCKYCGGC